MLTLRFLKKIIIDENNHWIWKGCKLKNGYGRILHNGKVKLAHRVALESIIGEIPKNMCALHKNSCHLRDCVNPDHIYLGTRKDNMRDRIKTGDNPQLSRTYCINGHEFNEENTYFQKDGHRCCRACTRKHALAYYYKNKDKINSKRRITLL